MDFEALSLLIVAKPLGLGVLLTSLTVGGEFWLDEFFGLCFDHNLKLCSFFKLFCFNFFNLDFNLALLEVLEVEFELVDAIEENKSHARCTCLSDPNTALIVLWIKLNDGFANIARDQ